MCPFKESVTSQKWKDCHHLRKLKCLNNRGKGIFLQSDSFDCAPLLMSLLVFQDWVLKSVHGCHRQRPPSVWLMDTSTLCRVHPFWLVLLLKEKEKMTTKPCRNTVTDDVGVVYVVAMVFLAACLNIHAPSVSATPKTVRLVTPLTFP